MTVDGGCWPTREQISLLRAVLLSGREAVRSWERWKEAIDIDRLDAGSVRLLPHLYRSLEREGVRDPLMGRLKGIYRHTWYANQLRLRDVAAILGPLRERGIEAMLLKGAALTLAYYRDAGLRPMEDVDIMVRTHQAHAAVEVLMERGWIPRRRVTPRHVEAWHAMEFTHAAAQPIDLHWHLLPESCSFRADEPDWERARQVRLHGVDVRVLHPSDQLLHVCAHGVKWEPVALLRWIADAAMILNHADAEIDWDQLVGETERHRLVLPVREGLTYVKEAFGLPVPTGVLERLRAARVPRTERWEYRLRTRPPNRLLGRLREHWLCYRRLRRGQQQEDAIGFVSYLQVALGCEGLGALARRALLRRRFRQEARHQAREYERELNRVALP